MHFIDLSFLFRFVHVHIIHFKEEKRKKDQTPEISRQVHILGR